MARNEQVTRILKIIHYLEMAPRGLGLSELINKLESDRIEVSERTLRRDLEAIQQIPLPLKKDGSSDDAKWCFDSIATISQKIQFSYHEMIALFLARESMNTFKASPLFVPINRLFERLEKALGISAKKELQSLSAYLEYKPSATWQTGVSQEVLDTIYAGCAEGQVLDLVYKAKSGDNKDQVKARRVGPESIYFADSGVYLIAKDLDKNEHRTYSVARIVEATMTKTAYDSKDFAIKEFIKDSFGTLRSGDVEEVEVFVQDPIAAYVSERRWHDTQQITRFEGGVQIRLKVRTNSELVRWILGLGAAARVVNPPGLKDLVVKTAIEIADQYGKKAA